MPATDLCTLPDHESRALLGTVSLGRLLFTENALPAIRPVTFFVEDQHIVVAVAGGSWVDKLDGVLVAFAADDIDQNTGSGWSVLVHGIGELVTHPRRTFTVPMQRVVGRRLVLTGG
jgi:hypothetical protein